MSLHRCLLTLAACVLLLAACRAPATPRSAATSPAPSTPAPTAAPTTAPTTVPTSQPTEAPSAVPSAPPTASPTGLPTEVPSALPTDVPAATPTGAPPAVQELTAFASTQFTVLDLAWAPDGSVLAAANHAGITFFDPSTLSAQVTLDAGIGANVVAYRADGQMLAAGTFSNTLQLWDVANRQLLRTIEDPGRPISGTAYTPREIKGLAFSPDGQFVAAAVNGYYSGGQGAVWVWNVASGERLALLSVYGPPTGLHFSPDGTSLAVSAAASSCARGGGGVMRWSAGTWEPLPAYTDQGSSVLDFAFDPAHPRAALTGPAGAERCTGNLVVQLWDTSGQMQATLADTRSAWNVSFRRGGAQLSAGYDTGDVLVWDLDTRAVRYLLSGLAFGVLGQAFNPDGSLLAAHSSDGMLSVWRVP